MWLARYAPQLRSRIPSARSAWNRERSSALSFDRRSTRFRPTDVLTWHTRGMARTRLSTTVDATLLDGARRLRCGLPDAALVDEALTALIARHRGVEIDASYAVYEQHPLDEPDAWGDLESFRRAAAAS